jgi:hypothetical protein
VTEIRETTDRLRTPAELIAGLRALRDHLRGLDSASPEAALMGAAADYIEGATDSLREHMAIARKRGGALRDLIAWGKEIPAPSDPGHARRGWAAFDKAKRVMNGKR